MHGVPGIDRAQFALTAVWVRAHPDNVNQGSWATVTDPDIKVLNGTNVGPGCGTTGCMAGTNTFANGMRLLYDNDFVNIGAGLNERTFEWAVPRDTRLLFDEDFRIIYPEGVEPAKVYNLAAQNLYGVFFDGELNPDFEWGSFEQRLYLACREHFQASWAQATYDDTGTDGVADILEEVALSRTDDDAIAIILDHTNEAERRARYQAEADEDDDDVEDGDRDEEDEAAIDEESPYLGSEYAYNGHPVPGDTCPCEDCREARLRRHAEGTLADYLSNSV